MNSLALRIKPSARPSAGVLILLNLALITLATGCATSLLWEDGRATHVRRPCSEPKLEFYRSSRSDDILVLYDECDGEGEASRRRAMLVESNQKRIQEGRKPDFSSLRAARPSHRIYTEGPYAAATPPAEAGDEWASVRYTPGTRRYVLTASGGGIIAAGRLPDYDAVDAGKRVVQILLTPFAVVADATVIGGVVVAFAAQDDPGAVADKLNSALGNP